MKRIALIMSVAALTGCGGGSDSTSPTTGINGAGSVTLSGAQTASLTSPPPAAVWASDKNTGAFALQTLSAGATAPTVTASIVFSGEPSVKQYKNSDGDAGGVIGVTLGTSSLWMAGGTQSAIVQGTYTLNLTSVSTSSTVTSGKTYAVHGTLDATLPGSPGSGTTGTVTVHATF